MSSRVLANATPVLVPKSAAKAGRQPLSQVATANTPADNRVGKRTLSSGYTNFMKKKSTVSKSTKEAITTLAIKQAGGAYEFWKILLKGTGCKFIVEDDNESGTYDIGLSKSKKPTRNYWRFTGKRSSKMGVGFINNKMVIARDAKGTTVSNALLG